MFGGALALTILGMPIVGPIGAIFGKFLLVGGAGFIALGMLILIDVFFPERDNPSVIKGSYSASIDNLSNTDNSAPRCSHHSRHQHHDDGQHHHHNHPYHHHDHSNIHDHSGNDNNDSYHHH